MEHPKAYLKPFGIMNMGMLIVLSLYAIIGFFGYWKYGDNAQGSITLNLPQDNMYVFLLYLVFLFVLNIYTIFYYI